MRERIIIIPICAGDKDQIISMLIYGKQLGWYPGALKY